MDSIATSGSGNGKCKKVDKTRRSWSEKEEEMLIQSLKEVISKGWKSENGFRAGYLNLLENAMHCAFPGTNLRGNPHINSKIHVWKKTYSSLVTLLSKSGVGWNDKDNTIDVTDETWESIVKHDRTLRTMRHKQWTHYNDWCEIFGTERATGDQFQNFEYALQDVMRLDDEVPMENFTPEIPSSIPLDGTRDTISETNTPSSKPNAGATSKLKKRKQVNDSDESIAEAINNLAYITKDTMSSLLKKMTAEEKLSIVQDKVLEALQEMNELSEDDHVAAAKLLFNNHNDLALFQRLRDRGRLCLVKRLLRGE